MSSDGTDYALAKSLKDAGWPQPIAAEAEGVYLAEPGSTADACHGILQEPRDDTAYAPTTDELIEALPKSIDWYGRTPLLQMGTHSDHETFYARYVDDYCSLEEVCADGCETIRIALSELWLTPEVQETLKEAGGR